MTGEAPHIVHTYTISNAPTGESTVRVDSNGTHWQDKLFPCQWRTGERQASIRDGRVYER